MPDLLVQYGLIARRVSTNQCNKIVDILEPAIVGRAAPECVIDIMDELNIESLLGVGGGNGLIKSIHLFRGERFVVVIAHGMAFLHGLKQIHADFLLMMTATQHAANVTMIVTALGN